MNREIEYINNVLDRYEISISWLARQMNVNPHKKRIWTKQNLDYLLTVGKEISVDTNREIRKVLDKHNFRIIDEDITKNIGDAISNLNTEASHLVNAGIESIEDHTITDEEKENMFEELKHIRKQADVLEKILQRGKL